MESQASYRKFAAGKVGEDSVAGEYGIS